MENPPSLWSEPVLVLGGTTPLARDHTCANRVLRGALVAEQRTVAWPVLAFEYLAAEAAFRLLGGFDRHGEPAGGIKACEGFAEPHAAVGYPAESPPGGIAGFEDGLHQLAGPGVAPGCHIPAILVFNPRFPGNDLFDQHLDPLQDVEG